MARGARDRTRPRRRARRVRSPRALPRAAQVGRDHARPTGDRRRGAGACDRRRAERGLADERRAIIEVDTAGASRRRELGQRSESLRPRPRRVPARFGKASVRRREPTARCAGAGRRRARTIRRGGCRIAQARGAELRLAASRRRREGATREREGDLGGHRRAASDATCGIAGDRGSARNQARS